ncbi:hypothetical protein EDC94DRAFT_661858 [Helicostylum pulchrum]|nr:hypothetical protein EDC94DRAFT_661858 [Helicostylum pulchrum]
MRREKAELRLANENEITTRDLLAENSKMIASRSRSGAPCADISSNRVADNDVNISSSNESSFIIDSPKALKEEDMSSDNYILPLFEVGYLIVDNEELIVEVDKFLSVEERLEITSNVYSRCQLPIVFCEHDFIIVDRYGIELGTCEFKPPGSSVVEVENDICRIGESTKRQLHRRIMQAKSEKETPRHF